MAGTPEVKGCSPECHQSSRWVIPTSLFSQVQKNSEKIRGYAPSPGQRKKGSLSPTFVGELFRRQEHHMHL